MRDKEQHEQRILERVPWRYVDAYNIQALEPGMETNHVLNKVKCSKWLVGKHNSQQFDDKKEWEELLKKDVAWGLFGIVFWPCFFIFLEQKQ